MKIKILVFFEDDDDQQTFCETYDFVYQKFAPVFAIIDYDLLETIIYDLKEIYAIKQFTIGLDVQED